MYAGMYTFLMVKNIGEYKVNNEKYEAYPNRDSTPYIKEYKFDPSWKINE